MEDQDCDGVANAIDNCPAVPNAEQGNGDGDEVGDACDLCPFVVNIDADGDGVLSCLDCDDANLMLGG